MDREMRKQTVPLAGHVGESGRAHPVEHIDEQTEIEVRGHIVQIPADGHHADERTVEHEGDHNKRDADPLFRPFVQQLFPCFCPF